MVSKGSNTLFLKYRKGDVCFTAYPILLEPTGFMFYLRRLNSVSQLVKLRAHREDLGNILLVKSHEWNPPPNTTGSMRFIPSNSTGVCVIGTSDASIIRFDLDNGESENLLAFVNATLPQIFGWSKQTTPAVNVDLLPAFIYL